jgi:hypothetical protein
MECIYYFSSGNFQAQISVRKGSVQAARLVYSYSNYATGWTIEESWLDYWQGQQIFPFSKAPRPALGPTQPPTELVIGVLSQK